MLCFFPEPLVTLSAKTCFLHPNFTSLAFTDVDIFIVVSLFLLSSCFLSSSSPKRMCTCRQRWVSVSVFGDKWWWCSNCSVPPLLSTDCRSMPWLSLRCEAEAVHTYASVSVRVCMSHPHSHINTLPEVFSDAKQKHSPRQTDGQTVTHTNTNQRTGATSNTGLGTSTLWGMCKPSNLYRHIHTCIQCTHTLISTVLPGPFRHASVIKSKTAEEWNEYSDHLVN